MIKKIVKKYFHTFAFCFSYIRYRSLLILFNSLIVGVLDGIGLALFIPLLQAQDGLKSSGSENMGKLKILVDTIEGFGLELNLNTILVLMLSLFLLKGYLKYWEKYYNGKVRQFFLQKLRFQMIDGMSNMRYRHFIVSDSGRIQNVLTGEVNRVISAFTTYFATAQSIIMVALYISLAFLSNWRFAILVLIAGIVTNFIFRILYKYSKKLSKTISHENDEFQSYLIQSVNYFKYLKATNTLKKYSRKLKQRVVNLHDVFLKMDRVAAILVGSREALTISVLILVILIQVNLLAGTISAIMLSLLFFYRSMGSILQVQINWNTFISNYGSFNNLKSFLNEINKQKDKPGTEALSAKFSKLSISHLSFGYNDEKVLKGISLSIEQNETIALVGESGSGKTTLINIISGLIDDYEGDFKINNVPAKLLNMRSWQSKIGYITQEPVIFDDSIANNITLWDDLKSTDSRMRFESALKRAAIYEYVEGLPEKENTRLGTNGVLVSGGQKQRISIARELYKDVDVLLLDEATSALDSETEYAIQKNIEELQGGYTFIVIAHRLSTVKNADKIVVLNNGSIEGIGSFDELMESNERFRNMVILQEF